MLKERIFRSFISNVLIAFVILSIFGITYFTIEAPAKANPDGAINRGESNVNVSLIFSVFEGTEYIDPILKILDQQKVSATFFVAGTWLIKNDELLQKIANSGHELGNNGYFKKDFSGIGDNEAKESVLATHKLVEAITGESMKYFLPPTGTYSNSTIDIMRTIGYQTIMWTHDAMDWQNISTDTVVENATKQTVAGDFVIMRPTKLTVDSLERIILNLKSKQLTLTSLSDTIN